ncbi:MAG: hypothetical protein M1484_03600 [Patescibacteria group bacterium]|nr:hypothetical protein [Patescibacteria group bacterium]MCL5432146.1 hypothetical protein [Patescibacteria group bacterium]
MIFSNWLSNVIAYETRRAIKARQTATVEKSKFQDLALKATILELKGKPSVRYGDSFNETVCREADIERTDLKTAEGITIAKIRDAQTDADLIKFLAAKSTKEEAAKLIRLNNQVQRFLPNQEAVLRFIALTFDNNGGYSALSDLDAYKSDPKLEPVPVI